MAAISTIDFKGYFDDSQTSGQVWAIGGYVGEHSDWDDFEATWAMALANHQVPYFHMREFQDPNGVYRKWYPAKDHEAELADFFSGLGKVIYRSFLQPFSCLVRLKDLERFNRGHGLNLQPYSLAAYGCMLLVGKEFTNRPVELVFDHVEKVESKLALARDYADSDSYYGPDGVFGSIITTGLPKKLTFKEVPAIQAADFWVWEWRKSHLRLDEWWSREDRPQDWGETQWQHMSEWVEQRYGSWESATRKSAQALLQRSNLRTMIWHYQELCDAHTARGGVWA